MLQSVLHRAGGTHLAIQPDTVVGCKFLEADKVLFVPDISEAAHRLVLFGTAVAGQRIAAPDMVGVVLDLVAADVVVLGLVAADADAEADPAGNIDAGHDHALPLGTPAPAGEMLLVQSSSVDPLPYGMPDCLPQKEGWDSAFVPLDVLPLDTLGAVVFAEHLHSKIGAMEHKGVHPCEVPCRPCEVPCRGTSEVRDRVCCVCGSVQEPLDQQVAASCI